MDERMLLLSLRRAGQSLTVNQLVAYWDPTWTPEQIIFMLTMLEEAGEIAREPGSICRFRALVREPEALVH